MTAINLFKTADAALLLTDQAWCAAGKLVGTGSKTAADPRLSMAIAINGAVTASSMPILSSWLRVRKSQADAMGAIGGLLGMIRDDAKRHGQHGADEAQAKLFIALWHPTLNRPECYLIDEAIVSVRHCDSPPSPEPFDADRAALVRRIEDQRRQANNIGAAAELTIVSRKGITSEIIHRWPDKLGEPITP